MRGIVKPFRRPPTDRIRDPKGGLSRLSDSVAPGFRYPASPRRALLAENLDNPSLCVMISAPWYNTKER
ncbi:MAG: hypothetical protein GKS00_00160 [Alphaproteobacteria bacterium]|nr:hypothetical protein [Alphaproteobacteria bacterium]